MMIRYAFLRKEIKNKNVTEVLEVINCSFLVYKEFYLPFWPFTPFTELVSLCLFPITLFDIAGFLCFRRSR